MEKITVKEAEEEYAWLWNEIIQLFPLLHIGDRLRILKLSISVCQECHEAYKPCQCWNDE